MADNRQTKRAAEGIYRRGTGKAMRYLVPIVEPGGGRKWHTLPAGTSLNDAKQFKRDREADKRRLRGKKEQTVAEFAGTWVEKFPRPSDSTNRHNRDQVRPFARDFATTNMREVPRGKARDWALEHRASVPALRAMFNDAISVDVCEFNPFANLRLPGSPGRKNIQVLTLDELDLLVGCARSSLGSYGNHFADFILVQAWTGLRPGESFALIPERVDFDRHEIHVMEQAENKTGYLKPTKNKLHRTIVMLPEAERALRRICEYREPQEFLMQPKNPRTRLHVPGPDGRVRAAFIGARLNFYWAPVRAAFMASLPATHWLHQRIREQGDNGQLDAYELRHLCGTQLAARGVSPYDGAEHFGHQDGGRLFMSTYTHPHAEDARSRIRGAFNEGKAA